MSKAEPWRDLAVWRCTGSDGCGEQWSSWNDESSCPFCGDRGERADFTYGEISDACERYGCEVPVHLAEPIPAVVRLSTLPRELWEGMPVLHPLSQEGDRANWSAYDVGVVIEIVSDEDFPGGWRCRFLCGVGSNSGTLLDGPDNLWVPRILVHRFS